MIFSKSYPHQNEKNTTEVIETPLGLIQLVARNGQLVGVQRASKLSQKKMKPLVCTKSTKLIQADFHILEKAKKELTQYFSGSRKKWQLPIKILSGTPFQKMVWAKMQKIPYGRTVSYSDLAKMVGCPRASRAVGQACNKNEFLIFIPCHRVIASNGKLGGFALGFEAKQILLDIESNIKRKNIASKFVLPLD